MEHCLSLVVRFPSCDKLLPIDTEEVSVCVCVQEGMLLSPVCTCSVLILHFFDFFLRPYLPT